MSDSKAGKEGSSGYLSLSVPPVVRLLRHLQLLKNSVNGLRLSDSLGIIPIDQVCQSVTNANIFWRAQVSTPPHLRII